MIGKELPEPIIKLLVKEKLLVPASDGSGMHGLNESFLESMREIQKSKECGGKLGTAISWALQVWNPNLPKEIRVLLCDGVAWGLLQLDPTLIREFAHYLAKDQNKALLERSKTIAELQGDYDNLK